MARRALGLALGAAGIAACAEPAIEMRLELPPADKASRFDVSCIGAVEVFIRGGDRGRPSEDFEEPGIPADDVEQCVTLAGVTSYDQLRQAIAGRFELELPGSGLAGVDVRGSTGTCKKDNALGDTIFYAAAAYDGGDEVVLRMTPNLSCNATRVEAVRPVDLLALTRAGACPPPLPDALMGGVDSATIHPSALSSAVIDYNNDFANTANGVASFPLYLSTDDASCIALTYGDKDDIMTAASCARRANGVCSAPGQIELPIIDYNVAYQAADAPSIDAYGGLLIGGIWGADGATRVKLTGATVRPAKTTDAGRSRIVYADYPAGASSPRALPGATATNATGLFIVYIGQPLDFVVSAPGYRDETLRLGSPDEPSTAPILLAKL